MSVCVGVSQRGTNIRAGECCQGQVLRASVSVHDDHRSSGQLDSSDRHSQEVSDAGREVTGQMCS